MIDLVQLQEFVYYRLLSFDRLSKFNVELLRRLRMQTPTDQKVFNLDPMALIMKSRAGVSGAGLLIPMPEIRRSQSLAPITEDQVALMVDCLEEPNINFTPGVGTFTQAETLAQLVRQALRGFYYREGGEFYDLDTGPITDASRDYDGYGVFIVTRVTVLVRDASAPLPKCDLPTAAIADDFTLTLTPPAGQPDAVLYYTLTAADAAQTGDMYPGSGNPVAQKYNAPFPTQAGDIICFAAEKSGYVSSNLDRITINP